MYKYGALYTWNATMYGNESSSTIPSNVQGVCPTGWHVPSDAEWTILTTFIGGENVAGGKLKEIGTTHWESPNMGATNETGFTALPSGGRNIGSYFTEIGVMNYWWSSTEYSTANVWYRFLHSDYSYVTRSDYPKQGGFSVRCMKDN